MAHIFWGRKGFASPEEGVVTKQQKHRKRNDPDYERQLRGSVRTGKIAPLNLSKRSISTINKEEGRTRGKQFFRTRIRSQKQGRGREKIGRDAMGRLESMLIGKKFAHWKGGGIELGHSRVGPHGAFAKRGLC